MDLALTEAQQMLKTLAADFLARELPPSLVRELEQDERGHSPDVWRKMAETGLIDAAFPQEYGGAGGGLTELGVILDEMGRNLYAGPYFATVVLGGLTLLYAGAEEQRRGLIPPVAQGQALLSPSRCWKTPAGTRPTPYGWRRAPGATTTRCPEQSCSWSTPT